MLSCGRSERQCEAPGAICENDCLPWSKRPYFGVLSVDGLWETPGHGGWTVAKFQLLIKFFK